MFLQNIFQITLLILIYIYFQLKHKQIKSKWFKTKINGLKRKKTNNQTYPSAIEYINLTLSKNFLYLLIHYCKILFFSLTWTVTYSGWTVCFSLTKYIASKKKHGIARAELKHRPRVDGQQCKQSLKWGCRGHKGLLVHSALANYSSSFQLWGGNKPN